MGRDSKQFIEYTEPRPFTLPTIAEIPNFPFPSTLIPRQTLFYSGQILEEIMWHVSDQLLVAGVAASRRSWTKYNAEGDTEEFIAELDGRNLSGAPLKFLPEYVVQVQEAIDEILAIADFDDTRSAMFARIFANNQGIPSQTVWNEDTKLKDNMQVNLAGSIQGIDALTRAQAGEWPFSVDYIRNITPFIGVTADRQVQADLDVEQSAGYPASQIGGDVQVENEDGVLETRIDGITGPMTSQSRPTYGNRTETDPTGSFQQNDPDQGYTILSHLALAIHQLRYQPPQIETFPNEQPIRDYTTNLISNTTPAIGWVVSQPTETVTQNFQNWGNWLIKGRIGITSQGLNMTAGGNPITAEASIPNCPLAVFFPPPEVTCSCTGGDNAYGIWFSSDYQSFVWSELQYGSDLPQFTGRARQKGFNRNTVLRIKGSASAGSAPISGTGEQVRVAVRTAVLGIIDVPFYTIGGLPFEDNLMDAIRNSSTEDLSWYNPRFDALLALMIEAKVSLGVSTTCPTIPGPGGVGVDDQCRDTFAATSCNINPAFAIVESVHLDEVALAGDPVDDY